MGAIFNALSLFFIGYKSGIVTFVSLNQTRWEFFYFIYEVSAVFLVGSIFFFQKKWDWKNILRIALIAFLPTEIFYLWGIEKKLDLNSSFGIATAVYMALFIIFLLIQKNNSSEIQENSDKPSVQKKWITIAIIVAVTAVNAFFGIHNIGKMAIVDEPLWIFDRIPDFWKNISNQDWYKSRVSDKPGLTAAVVSGAGLLFEKNPKQFENIKWNGEIYNTNYQRIEKFNAIFRLPIFILEILLLPLFYFFLKKLFNCKIALFSFILIALSPILLGNSRIINPDSSLWIFTSFALLTYSIHLKNNSRKYLYLAALFLTLSILTKYVANFLYIFFFGLIFMEYIFNKAKYTAVPFREYIKKSLKNYGLLVVMSVALFYVLYPACWAKPSRVLIGTIYSQAFIQIWPFFASAIIIILIDLFLLKARVFSAIINFFSKYSDIIYKIILSIFVLSLIITALNIYAGMGLFDAEKILSSPKSSSRIAGLWQIFLADFYPIVFGISPIAFLAIVVFIIKDILNKNKSTFYFSTISIIIFTLLYYLGSVFSHVSLTIRYQIIIYPIILILAGISMSELLTMPLFPKKWLNLTTASLLLVAISLYSLVNASPFFMGYASELLPKKYSIDLKGMGEGSYEAAQYLNSLPNADELHTWSDKQGVCTFFIGTCHTSLNKKFFEQNEFDYFVVSSDRATRTINMIASKIAANYDLNALYYSDNLAQKTILIGGRSSNFIKITPGNKIAK